MRLFIILLFTAGLFSCKGINKVLKSNDPAYKLRVAEQYFVKKKYNQAQILFEDVLPFFNGKTEFEDIYYKFAYCFYNQRDFVNSEYHFKHFLELFPNSTRAEEIEYMYAYTFYRQSPKAPLDQSNTLKAIGIMQAFISNHPNSERAKEAVEIVNISRDKLEKKEESNAKLYYDLGNFRAAAVTYSSLLSEFPETTRGDEYQLMVVKSYYKFAELSIRDKQEERYGQVITECNNFIDRFPESKLLEETERFITLSNNNIKTINNEQTKTPG